MATKKTSANGTSNRPSAAEMRDWFEKNKGRLERFEDAKDALLNLRSISKDTRYRTVQKITKEDLKRYLENPNNYEEELRNISRYLVTRCQIYYRLIKYYANMFRLDARSVIPNYSLIEDNDKDAVLESYESTLKILDKMGLQLEFLKVYTICMIEDVYYGVKYFDENSNFGNSLFLLQMPPQYCKLQGIFPNGTLAYSLNMDFFKRNKDLLELWGEPFQSMQKQYDKDGIKWVLMPQEYSVCLKFRIEDLDLILSPFAGLFNALLGLLELEDLEDIAAEQEIYKLLVATIPTIQGTEDPNDFAVDPAIAVDYFNKMCDALPSYTDAIISPIPVDYISFDKNRASNDINKVQNATKTVLNTSGGSQVLNSADISSSSGYEATFKLDTEFALSSLLPQTERHVNYWISQYTNNPAKVKFYDVSTYTIKQFREELLENAQNSLPTKLALASMSGLSELDALALNFLEEDVLGLADRFSHPLSTSYTQSNNDGTKDVDDLSDEGELTRDKDKNG
ncbi:MAG: hypothetical protein KBT35_01570 [Firmicutes bacterium]|nr:hypothetical protein [Candidatus Colivicinus equi]